MFMGIDVRYAFLGFSYSMVGSGLYLRYLDIAGNVGMNYSLTLSMALIGLGMLVTNRAFCMHFLRNRTRSDHPIALYLTNDSY